MILRYARWPATRLTQRLAGYTALIACRCTGTRHDPQSCAKIDVGRIVAELHRRGGGGGSPLATLFTPAAEAAGARSKRGNA
jgi:hypothetical protein